MVTPVSIWLSSLLCRLPLPGPRPPMPLPPLRLVPLTPWPRREPPRRAPKVAMPLVSTDASPESAPARSTLLLLVAAILLILCYVNPPTMSIPLPAACCRVRTISRREIQRGRDSRAFNNLSCCF